MTDTAEQPTLDLGNYRGQKITKTAVKLANANDGFDPSTSMSEPRIFEIGERVTLAVEAVVVSHLPKAVDVDADEVELMLTQTFKAGLVAVVPRRAVQKELNAAARARDAAEKAKKAGKKATVRRGHLSAVGESLEAVLQEEPSPE